MISLMKLKRMLRDYQIEMLERLQEMWTKARSVMVQMPTGTGKTVLLAELIRKELRNENIELRDVASQVRIRNYHVLVVAHRRELISQISQTLDGFGIDHGLIVSGKPLDPTKAVQVASIQTLARSLALSTLHFSLVIIDEAHHALAKTYRMLWDWWPEARFLGLTATPCRLNNTPFTDLFQALLQSYSIQQFIALGWLADFEYVSARPDSDAMQRIASLKKRGADGDYQTKEMATVMDCPESIEHLYRSYKEFANGKKGIVYAIDRQHAAHIAAYYQQMGVSCGVIDAKTPAEERRKLVARYKGQAADLAPSAEGKDDIDVLVNVDIFSEGFDCPDVEFIQLARPTLSLSKYLQQVGRGLRVTEGKECVLILDQVGLYQTFGMPTDERDWQQTFLGKVSGRGLANAKRGVVIDTNWHDKTLVNLEMVRIKRRKEEHKGLEIFMLDGKYGVQKDGKVVCPANFEHIKRIGHPYFALGTYPYEVYEGRVTVIDARGWDLKMRLYGNVTYDGDIFRGQGRQGDDLYWDCRSKRYFTARPEVAKMGMFEVLKVKGMYYLRYTDEMFNRPFQRGSVYFGRRIAIFGNLLFREYSPREVYTIVGYTATGIVVKTPLWEMKYAMIDPEDCVVWRGNTPTPNMRENPNLDILRLSRA